MAEGYAINYNGFKLEVLRVWQYVRTPHWNGPDYLYTQHDIYCRCLFHPNAVAYRQPGVLAAIVQAKNQNVAGAETDAAIRHGLSQPRCPLVYTIPNLTNPAQDRVILRSPTFNRTTNAYYTCDAKGGPYPKVLQVAAVKGVKSFLVDFAVTTYVNECDLYVSTPSVMLSHRWTAAEDIDQDAFSTRTIRGHVVFRKDRLLSLGTRADDYRDYFASHVVPANFRRDRVSVVVAEDGAACDYVVIDRERAVTIYGPGIRRAEIVFGHRFRFGGFENAGLDAINIINPFKIGQGQMANPGDDVRGGGNAGFGDVVRGVKNFAPILNDTFTVRVWGSRETTRQQLLDGLAAVVNKFFAHLANVTGGLADGVAVDTNVDLMGRYADMTLATIRGPFNGTIASITDAIAKQVFQKSSLQVEDIPNLIQRADSQGVTLPRGSRGSYLKGLFTAALLGSCGTPERASAAEPAANARSLTPTGQ